MRFGRLRFGSIEIDGVTYTHDVVIDHGRVRKRKKKPSRKFREVGRGEGSLEVPSLDNRHRKLWVASCDG